MVIGWVILVIMVMLGVWNVLALRYRYVVIRYVRYVWLWFVWYYWLEIEVWLWLWWYYIWRWLVVVYRSIWYVWWWYVRSYVIRYIGVRYALRELCLEMYVVFFFVLCESDIEWFGIDYFIVYFCYCVGGFVGRREGDECGIARNVRGVTYDAVRGDGVKFFE